MTKAKVTITFEYELKPENYPDCETIEEMIAIDEENIPDIIMWEIENNQDLQMGIEPME